ncbi:MAG: hypothetical protein ABI347_06615 [Nitrososphaera sp.]|jgi:hypothetical protein
MPKDFTFKMRLTDEQAGEMTMYINSLPPSSVLFGLRFAYNRHSAATGGYLMQGRKSMVKRETHLLSAEQAKWRLSNWKTMIRTYREKGYSYPTISRIKKQLQKIASKK